MGKILTRNAQGWFYTTIYHSNDKYDFNYNTMKNYNKEEVMAQWRDTNYMTGEKPNQTETFLSTALDSAYKAGEEARSEEISKKISWFPRYLRSIYSKDYSRGETEEDKSTEMLEAKLVFEALK